jgi:hypothetical protein
MRQDALTWFKDNYWVIFWDIFQRFVASLLAPIFMQDSALRLAKVAIYLRFNGGARMVLGSEWYRMGGADRFI